jgi:uncharacterized membrane protein HdeD (DUF308 family)
MKYIDFGAQLLLILTAAIWTTCNIPSGSAIATLLIFQFFIGAWQILSAVIGVFCGFPYQKQRGWYLASAFTYLFMLFILAPVVNIYLFQILIAMVPAWCFAIYSCYLSYRTAFPKSGKHTGNFLRHISF